MITEKLSSFNIHKLTQAQYDRESSDGNLDETAMYLTPDTDGRTFYLDNVVCVGDSFLDGATRVDYVSGHGWGKYLYDLAKEHNPGAIFRYKYLGGSGYVQKGGEEKDGDTFANHITKVANEIGDKEIPAVQTVIIIGGVNDIRNGHVINYTDKNGEDYSEAVDLAKEKFPNAKIVLAMNPLCSRYVPNSTIGTNEWFTQLLTESTDPRVCVLTESCNWLIANEALNGDNLHPSKEGYKRIAEHLYFASYGFPRDYRYQYSVTYPCEADVGGAAVSSFGNVTVTYSKEYDNMLFSVTGTVNSTSGEYILLGTRPIWMSRANPVQLQLGRYNVQGGYELINGTYLEFDYGGVFLRVPEHTGELRINGTATIGIKML